MTSTVARCVQTWFTPRMTNSAPTKRRRETIEAKAERLVAEGSYTKMRAGVDGGFWVGTCQGDHGTYNVLAIAQWFMDTHGIAGGDGNGLVGCDCRTGRNTRLCSHALGADKLRSRGEFE